MIKIIFLSVSVLFLMSRCAEKCPENSQKPECLDTTDTIDITDTTNTTDQVPGDVVDSTGQWMGTLHPLNGSAHITHLGRDIILIDTPSTYVYGVDITGYGEIGYERKNRFYFDLQIRDGTATGNLMQVDEPYKRPFFLNTNTTEFYNEVERGGKKFCVFFSDDEEEDRIYCDTYNIVLPSTYKGSFEEVTSIDYTKATPYSVYVNDRPYERWGNYDVYEFLDRITGGFASIELPVTPEPPYYFVKEDGTKAPLEDLAL